jgi:serine/threonine-protein kinase
MTSGIIQVQHTRSQEPEGRIGQQLNAKWKLLRVLGVGGAATVYEAMHRNGRRAAVKIMSQQKIREMPTYEVATHEALLANAVSHPGVVEVLDDDIAEDGSAYLVMELLEGETLESRRRRAGGRLALDEAMPLFEQLLDVLTAAHERGIVHRDLKPDNVFVTSRGRVKVLDFGLAAVWAEEQEDSPWFGTPGFMPPEQARAEWPHVDALSDLWAAAATFFTVLTGRLVHMESTPAALVRAAASEDVDLSPLEAVAPIHVVDVFERALASDKADRFPTARALRVALGAAARLGRGIRPARAIPKPALFQECRSATRMFLLQGGVQGSGCNEAGPCRLACTKCPVCPGNVATLQCAV